MYETVHFQHGELNGQQIRYYPDGNFWFRENWSKGRRDGVWEWFHGTGDRHSRCSYIKGFIVGKKVFWSNKSRVREEDHVDGSIAKVCAWYVSGKKRMEGKYENGKKAGRWAYWKEDGSLQYEGEWKDGQPWSGYCGVPADGEAGSVGGAQVFSRYRKGKNIGDSQVERF